jgi:BirA family biotin operon repressor/biotin-[acetyl-CoA-carboxylase] ligase
LKLPKNLISLPPKVQIFNHFDTMISIAEPLTVLGSVDSTNNYAMARVRAGLAKPGEAFFAMEQTAGRGQRGRRWQTEPGSNIILSIALQPYWLQVSQQFLLSAAVSTACHDFFSGYAGEETKIKWPNDIYWRDRKAGGILIENIIRGGSSGQSAVSSQQPGDSNEKPLQSKRQTPNAWYWSIIGIGININQTNFPEGSGKPVSLKQITGREWDVLQMAKELCACIQNRCRQLEQDVAILPHYNLLLYKRGESVRLKKGSRVFDATINGVDTLGKLLVTTVTEEIFDFGEIEWVLS